MAKVAFSAIISGARGKLAGLIFSANGSGPYLKSWAKGPTKHFPLQAPPRQFMSSHGSAWWTISQSDRDNWSTWAALPAQAKTDALGQTYYCSGWQWFVSLNQRLRIMGRTPITVYPSTLVPATPTLSTFAVSTATDGTLVITYPSGEWTSYDMVLFLSARSGPGQSVGFLNNATSVLQKQAVIHATTETVTDLGAIVGSLSAGMRCFLWAFRQNIQGRRSSAATSYADVT